METPPLGLADAFIAAGARTVVQKLWYDEETVLADTVGCNAKLANPGTKLCTLCQK